MSISATEAGIVSIVAGILACLLFVLLVPDYSLSMQEAKEMNEAIEKRTAWYESCEAGDHSNCEEAETIEISGHKYIGHWNDDRRVGGMRIIEKIY